MAKATINRPEPPPAEVTLTMTEAEAKWLLLLAGRTNGMQLSGVYQALNAAGISTYGLSVFSGGERTPVHVLSLDGKA